MYEPAVAGAVAVIEYPPVEFVVVVTMCVLQLDTSTTVSLGNPAPLDTFLSRPDTENVPPVDVLLGEAVAVMLVEDGLGIDPVFRFSVMLPGPGKVTAVKSEVPPHTKYPEQVQFEIV